VSAMQWIESLISIPSDLGYISQQHLEEILKREGAEGFGEEPSRGARMPQILTSFERKHLWRQD